MKVLVTGASGLIGGWVVERLLKEKIETIGLDLLPQSVAASNYVHYRGSILNALFLKSTFSKTSPDAVIHLAARVDLNGRRAEDYPENIEGVKNIVSAIRGTRSIQRVLYTSSQLVCRVGHVPCSNTEYCPDTPYGESKVLTEQIVREHDSGGVVWCVVRPTSVWGPGMSRHYQRMLDLIRRGHYFHCGHGKLYKSYAYAGNIAFQYYKLLQAPVVAVGHKMFYLADYQPLSLRDYTNDLARELGARTIPTMPLSVARIMAKVGDIVEKVTGRSFPFNSFRLKNILTEYVFDLRPTESVCGPLPFTYNEGVRETASWFLKDVVGVSRKSVNGR